MSTQKYILCDFSKESPIQRRSCCYDEEARLGRKKNAPLFSAKGFADSIGAELLNEKEYFILQEKGNFDTKTSSWLKTDDSLRKLDGAIFGDKRFNRTFIYHNKADSYYADRGFRMKVEI
ncbi:MAG: DUF4256 domain-containing protein [Bacilli bacterium]|nr:DUF4256 domain-containing protein [Bacilli bacterium]